MVQIIIWFIQRDMHLEMTSEWKTRCWFSRQSISEKRSFLSVSWDVAVSFCVREGRRCAEELCGWLGPLGPHVFLCGRKTDRISCEHLLNWL